MALFGTDLYYVHNKIEEAIAKYLANDLKIIKLLDLKGYNIQVEGAKYLAKRLKDIPVQNVNLACNNLGDEGTKYIASGLKGSEVICLNLEYNMIGDDGTEQLAIVLNDSQVQNLNMKSNKIGVKGAAYLSRGMKGSQVQTLNLGYNSIGDVGVKYIANALKYSQIKNLNLKDNDIGPNGAEFLVNGLKESQVQNLNLKDNYIYDDGAIHIFDSIADTCVQSLNLYNTLISQKGAKYIANAIKDTQVTNINLNLNLKYSETASQIRKVLHKNYQNLADMCYGFKLLVTTGADGPLVFQVHTDVGTDKCIDVEKYLHFVKTLHDTPSIVPHVAKDPNIDFAKHDIVQFAEDISIQFCEFLSKVLEEDNSKYVDLLKMCEDMHLDYIVKDLLLNRGACTIEANTDVLYPYVYILLDRYKLPLLANHQAFKCNEKEIIGYFLDHLELDYALEAIRLLDNINKNKKRRIFC